MAKPKTQATLPGVTDRRIAALLTLLAENATIVVSGARIAREIGVSRSTVWRWVNRLRELGVRVKGEQHSGYFLEKVPDILTPDMLRQRLKGSLFGKRIHHFFKADSTNRVALELGHAGEPEGAVVLAEEQTAGRGRAGHAWHSERATGIYATLLLRPHLAPVQAPLLTMMAGLSAHAAIQAQTGLNVDLKWPNDVLIGGKKVCGILTEMNAEITQVRYIVVGIGINVNHASFPEDLAGLATSLRLESGSEWSRVELAAALLKSLHREYRKFLEEADAKKSILRRFAERSSWVSGKAVRIEDGGSSSDGAFEGITEGLDDRGFLRVRTARGVRTVLSGTVRERGMLDS